MKYFIKHETSYFRIMFWLWCHFLAILLCKKSAVIVQHSGLKFEKRDNPVCFKGRNQINFEVINLHLLIIYCTIFFTNRTMHYYYKLPESEISNIRPNDMYWKESASSVHRWELNRTAKLSYITTYFDAKAGLCSKKLVISYIKE